MKKWGLGYDGIFTQITQMLNQSLPFGTHLVHVETNSKDFSRNTIMF